MPRLKYKLKHCLYLKAAFVLKPLRATLNLVVDIISLQQLDYGLLLLTLLVSNLIPFYSLIVASRSYVDKLVPATQSSMFKRRTVPALK